MSRRKYDPKLKADVIEAIIESGRSAAQVARDYDLAEHTVYS
jgi:transposase-like protein